RRFRTGAGGLRHDAGLPCRLLQSPQIHGREKARRRRLRRYRCPAGPVRTLRCRLPARAARSMAFSPLKLVDWAGVPLDYLVENLSRPRASAPSTNTAGPYTIPRPFCKKSILEDNVEEARRFGPQINVPGLASFHRDGFRQVARLVTVR